MLNDLYIYIYIYIYIYTVYNCWRILLTYLVVTEPLKRESSPPYQSLFTLKNKFNSVTVNKGNVCSWAVDPSDSPDHEEPLLIRVESSTSGAVARGLVPQGKIFTLLDVVWTFSGHTVSLLSPLLLH